MVKKFSEFVNERFNNLDVDNMDFKGFCDYLNDKYDYVDLKLKREAKYQGYGIAKPSEEGFEFYLKPFPLNMVYENGELMIVSLKNEVENNKDVCDILQDIAEIDTYIHNDEDGEVEVVTFRPIDGSDVTNRFFLQLVDYIIDNVDDCGIKRI